MKVALIRFVLPVATLLLVGSVFAKGPVKVFILAGQSNMEGHAKVETFDYIGDDPATAPLLKSMRGPDNKPRVCQGAWISYLTGRQGNLGSGFGRLTSGYGARREPNEDGGKIGPEFTFGITMDQHFSEPVLIIKTAWGGKSLFYDFRPPSSGPYRPTARDLERNRNPPAKAGHYYRLMIGHVKNVLKDVGRVCPEFDPSAGYELRGFVWFQGWNDLVNRDIYPIRDAADAGNRFARYSDWLGDLIRDVRKDLDSPELPVVIGVMGVGGDMPNEHVRAFRQAMAATAEFPELRDTVVAVPTAPFWDAALAAIDQKRGEVRQMGHLLRTKNKNHANKDGQMTPRQQREYLQKFEADLISPAESDLWQRGASNAAYHYLGCAKTFARMGQAFAHELIRLDRE